MALVISNCFDALADDGEIEHSNNINQKQEQAPAMKNQETKSEVTSVMRQAKPRQSHGHDNFAGRSGTKIIRTPNPKEVQHVTSFGDAMQSHHLTQTERKLSLKEYEKDLLEKKKTLNLNLKSAADHEERKLSLDKDFESMALVGKKKEDYEGLSVKPAKFDVKANKVHSNKAVDVSGFFYVRRRPPPRSYAVDNGESTSITDEADTSARTTTINIEDDAQFPALN